MKTLHILGGGPGQLGLIRRARELGYRVIVSDRNPYAPGLALADIPSHASSFSREEVRRDARLHGADFLLTAGTDQPVLTCAQVSHDLGLPYFLSPEQALLVTNKGAMKRALAEEGIPQRSYALLSRDFSPRELDHLTFPLVMKPLDSQGQRGVLKVNSIGEIMNYLPYVLSFSQVDKILIEEYYENARELTISGWVEEGTPHLFSITDRVTVDNGPHIGVCIAHRYPSLRHGDWDVLEDLTRRITAMIGLDRGPLYFQILHGPEGYGVNEIACRLGGAYEDVFLPWLCGVPLLDFMIEMTGHRPYNRELLKGMEGRRKDKYLSLEMFFYRPGVIYEQTGMDLLMKQEGILGGSFLMSPGIAVLSRDNSTQRAGYFIVTGQSPGQVRERVDRSYRLLRVIDEKGENLLCRF